MTLHCDSCIYFDTDKDEQPCCSCFDGVNYEKSEVTEE